MLTAGNAKRLLMWWRPAGPAARICKTWECSSCHRQFEEALNPAEALPTDQNYYEKHQFRSVCPSHLHHPTTCAVATCIDPLFPRVPVPLPVPLPVPQVLWDTVLERPSQGKLCATFRMRSAVATANLPMRHLWPYGFNSDGHGASLCGNPRRENGKDTVP